MPTVCRLGKSRGLPVEQSVRVDTQVKGGATSLLQPRIFHLYEAVDALVDLQDLLRIELQHDVAEVQHPLFARVAGDHLDLVRVGDLDLAPSTRASVLRSSGQDNGRSRSLEHGTAQLPRHGCTFFSFRWRSMRSSSLEGTNSSWGEFFSVFHAPCWLGYSPASGSSPTT